MAAWNPHGKDHVANTAYIWLGNWQPGTLYGKDLMANTAYIRLGNWQPGTLCGKDHTVNAAGLVTV